MATSDNIVYIEVEPYVDNRQIEQPHWSPCLEHELQDILDDHGSMRIEWDAKKTDGLQRGRLRYSGTDKNDEWVELRHTDPLLPPTWPCRVSVYALPRPALSPTSLLVAVIRARPPRLHLPAPFADPTTMREMAWRMRHMLDRSVTVGTSADAYNQYQKRQRQLKSLARALGNTVDHEMRALSEDGGLVVYNDEHGSSKTMMVRHIAQEVLGCRAIVVTAAQFLARYGTQSDAALQSWLHQQVIQSAVRGERVCLIIDHLEDFVTLSDTAEAPVVHAMAAHLGHVASSLRSELHVPFPTKNPLYGPANDGIVLFAHVCLVGVATLDRAEVTHVESSLRMDSYHVRPLTPSARLSVFRHALRESNLQLSPELEALLSAWASKSADVRMDALVKGLRYRCASSSTVRVEDFVAVLSQNGQSSLGPNNSQVFQALETKQASMDSVGGNQVAKEVLLESLSLDPQRRAILAHYGVHPPTGVMLYGPPGCGKTLLAKSVARVMGGSFLALDFGDVVLSEVGESEKQIGKAFEQAKQNAPSVVFLDEFQALFTARSSGGSSRLSTTLMECMDALQSLSGTRESSSFYDDKRVVVLAATNTPWMVDKAFLRPGRFDRIVYVGLPSLQDRCSILKQHLSPVVLEEIVPRESLVDDLAARTDRFSGADLEALCRQAATRCLQDQRDHVAESDFTSVLTENIVVSSADDVLLSRLETWKP